MNKQFSKNFVLRYTFVLIALLALLPLLLPPHPLSARPQTQEAGESTTTTQLFLPLITNSRSAATTTEVVPLDPTQYNAFAEEAPTALTGEVVASTCSTFIRFSNTSSQTIKVYWLNYNNQETLYATLSAGVAYWQQTFYGNTWIVRDLQGNQVKRFTVSTCNLIFITISNSDFPNPHRHQRAMRALIGCA
jgi:hypothetical protein